ncbi:unnamed protein product [Protopolystoma xenopodis]|uniref:Uncharacterized protein n=1 Tax=Protopolystoma xenopodis TaxID=117903 RepID=A0A448WTI5_9PLAT|nr:unnamed protein product [Protopolystoma xenopodis]
MQGKKFTECSALLDRARSLACQTIEALSESAQSSDDYSTSVRSYAEEVVPGPTAYDLINQLRALDQQASVEQLTCCAGRMLELAGGSDAASAAEEDEAELARGSISIEVKYLCEGVNKRNARRV